MTIHLAKALMKKRLRKPLSKWLRLSVVALTVFYSSHEHLLHAQDQDQYLHIFAWGDNIQLSESKNGRHSINFATGPVERRWEYQVTPNSPQAPYRWCWVYPKGGENLDWGDPSKSVRENEIWDMEFGQYFKDGFHGKLSLRRPKGSRTGTYALTGTRWGNFAGDFQTVTYEGYLTKDARGYYKGTIHNAFSDRFPKFISFTKEGIFQDGVKVSEDTNWRPNSLGLAGGNMVLLGSNSTIGFVRYNWTKLPDIPKSNFQAEPGPSIILEGLSPSTSQWEPLKQIPITMEKDTELFRLKIQR